MNLVMIVLHLRGIKLIPYLFSMHDFIPPLIHSTYNTKINYIQCTCIYLCVAPTYNERI